MFIVSRLVLVAAALCLVAALACFGIYAFGIVRLMIDSPHVEVRMLQVENIKQWGWRSLGLAVAGFTLLWFMPRGSQSDDE